MQFISLSIQGFRSFQKQSVFEFPSGPGLYLLSGRNEVEPNLGANGAGKSTIWDALFWCLYNKTLRGLKGNSVVNWGSDHTEVTLTFLDTRDQRIEVTRTRNPNRFTVNGSDISTEDFLDEFQVSADAFSSIVVMSQFGRYFFDRTPTEQLGVFSALLHLAYWEDKGQLAADSCKDLETRLIKLEKEESKVVGKLDELSDRLNSAKQDREQFEENRDAERDQVREEIELVDIEVSGAQQALADAQEQLQAAEEAQDRTQDRLAIVADILEQCNECRLKLKVNVEHSEEELVEVQGLSEACPLCDQDVPADHKEELVEFMQSEHQDAQGQYVEALASYEKNKELHKTELNEFQLAKKKFKYACEVFDNAREEQKHVLSRSCTLQELLSKLESQENPFEEQLQSVKKRIQMTQKQLSEIQQRIQAAREHAESYRFWAKGFKDLRLWLIDTAATELEVNVNNCLMDLGLDEWAIHFDVERAAKSRGKTIKGFHVMVDSPESAAGTPWASWSGGETQRLRIAGAIGLADLATARTGFSPSIEVWDEPTAHLSAEGIDDLLVFLKNRAAATGKQIWLVDHRSLDSGHFFGETTVVKDEDGSFLMN